MWGARKEFMPVLVAIDKISWWHGLEYELMIPYSNKYERYYGPGREYAQQLQQLTILRTCWPADMLCIAVTAVACTSTVYANELANYSLIRK